MNFSYKFQLIIIPLIIIPTVIGFYMNYKIASKYIFEANIIEMEENIDSIISKCETEVAILERLKLSHIDFYENSAKLKIIEDIKTKEFSSRYVFVYDMNQNQLLYHPKSDNKQIIGNLISKYIPKISEQKQGSMWYESGIQNVSKELFVYDYFEKWNWLIVEAKDEKEIYKITKEIKTTILGFGLIFIICNIIILYIVYRSISKPLISLREAANKVKERNYNVSCEINSKDELGLFAKAFNQMIAELKKRKEETEKLISDLRKSNIKMQHLKEEADESNKAKSEFLANMSHELRTPMNGILGFTQILMQIETDEQKLDDIKTIKNSADHLLGLINDILDLSKIEAGKYEINKKEFDLYESITIISKILENGANVKGIKYILDIDDVKSKRVLTDENCISQIIINLVNNAIKFTDEGFVKLSLKIKQNILEIKVKDTGIGINESKQKNLYEPFKQGEHFLTKKYGGTGLGLSIVKRMVDFLYGSIEVETVLGEGTEFKILIPIKTVEAKQSMNYTPKQEIIELSNRLNRKLKIISVDDVETNHDVIDALFRNENVEIKRAYNGREVLDEIENGKVDFILMDVQLPILNGLEATKIIRKESKYKDIKIIGVSAFAYNEDVKKALEAGMDDYIKKPISKNDLFEKMNKLING